LKIDERELLHVLTRLEKLKAGIIDTSSIIYLRKAGFYEQLRSAVRLLTIPAVIDEAGMEDLEIEILGDVPEAAAGTSTDAQLFNMASTLGKALISEDRSILLRCRDKGIDYYNAYMMLVLLRYRGIVDQVEYTRYESALIEIAHYGPAVREYGKAFSDYLPKVM
jgi:hypothetical protein